MFCGKCGTKANDNDKYCMNCGNKLIVDVINKEDIAPITSCYNPIDKYSYINLITSVIIFIMALLPIHQTYMITIIGVSVIASIVNIIRYRLIKDKVLFISILISSAALYTALGWLYYLNVK